MPSTGDDTPNSRLHHSAVDNEQSVKGSDSEVELEMDNDDDDDEEYEEIEEEVEVEEEVEEVVEVEEEEEIGDELSPIDEDQNDVSRGMEYKGIEEHLRSGSSDPENFGANLQSDTLAVEGGIGSSIFSSASETRQKGESRVNIEDPKYPQLGKHLVASKDDAFQEFAGDQKDSGAFPERGTPKHDEEHNNSKASQCDSGIMIAETTKPFSSSGKEVAAAILIRDGFNEEDNGIRSFGAEIKQMDTESRESINQGPTRLAVPQIRPRSLSPTAKFDNVSKRPAVICEFFAKGWCIKGNSCRFLHIKDHVNITSQKPERDVATSKEKKLQGGGGLRDSTERSQSADFPNAGASSAVHGSSFPLERMPSWGHGENPRLHNVSEKHKILSLQREDLSHAVRPDSLQSPIYKDNASSITSVKDVGRDYLRQNWSSDDYPAYRNSCFPERRSHASSSVISSDTYRSTGIPSHATSLEDMAARRSQFMLYDRSSPVFSSSLNSSFSPSLPTTSILPAQDISAWTRSSIYLSSLDTDPLGTPKFSFSDREYRASRPASLMRSSLPFTGFEAENGSLANVSGGPLSIGADRTEVYSNDWKPSSPFRPKSFIIQSLLSPGSLYDPIRDSIEQPNLGDGFSKFSSREETSITNTPLIIDDDLALTRTLGPECGSDKHSISGHHKFHGNTLDKNFQEKDFFRTGDTVRISHAEQKNRNDLRIEEKLWSPARVKDTEKANKIDLDDQKLQLDGSRHKKEIKEDRGRQKNEMDVDLRTDEEQKESKALKHFRAALIEFVKEMVKPTWREGHLSKDAHKMIVKKAVDKVTSTLQPHQTPSTAESIKQYLAASQPKILKLVEGYVVKYGKS